MDASYSPSKATWDNAAYNVHERFQHAQETVSVATDFKNAHYGVDLTYLMQCLMGWYQSMTGKLHHSHTDGENSGALCGNVDN